MKEDAIKRAHNDALNHDYYGGGIHFDVEKFENELHRYGYEIKKIKHATDNR